jgi:hypothetical protein
MDGKSPVIIKKSSMSQVLLGETKLFCGNKFYLVAVLPNAPGEALSEFLMDESEIFVGVLPSPCHFDKSQLSSPSVSELRNYSL